MAEVVWFRTSARDDLISVFIYIEDTVQEVTRIEYRNDTLDTPCEAVIYMPNGEVIYYPLNANTSQTYVPRGNNAPSVVGVSVAFHAYQTPQP